MNKYFTALAKLLRESIAGFFMRGLFSVLFTSLVVVTPAVAADCDGAARYTEACRDSERYKPMRENKAFFVRVGDIFLADGPGLYEDISSYTIAGGYRTTSKSFDMDHCRLSLEGEMNYYSTSESIDIGVDTIDTNLRVLNAVATLRWEWSWDFPVRPFAAAGGGASITRLSVEDSFANTDSSQFSATYVGRSGVDVAILDHVSMELGYRYQRVGRDADPFGVHAAEMGLVWRF